MRAALLWTHILSGVIWIAACACLALASGALATEGDEFRDFAVRVVPRLNRLNLVAAIVLGVTGALNLAQLGTSGFAFSSAFVRLLEMKLALFIAMALMLAASWRSETAMRATQAGGAGTRSAAMRRVALLSALTALAGGAALVMALWLAGS